MSTKSAAAPVRSVKITNIEIGKRLRNVNREKVCEIAKSISDIGLLYPIVVWKSPDGRLVLAAGKHRLEAFRVLGKSKIQAKIVDCLSEEDARLVEIDDNLCRSDLTLLEIIIQLRLKEDILIRRGLRSMVGCHRQNNRVTTAQMAKDVNIPKRRFQELMHIARGIPATLARDVIMGRPLANHQQSLMEIANIPNRKLQEAVIFRAAALEDISTAKVMAIITNEMHRRKSKEVYKPISRQRNKSVERLFIERIAKTIKNASLKISRAVPTHAAAFWAAKGMIEQLTLILEAAGIPMENDERDVDYTGAFLPTTATTAKKTTDKSDRKSKKRRSSTRSPVA